MIFQEPIASLSPVHTIGEQIMEMVLLHRTTNKREAKEIVLDMLNKVGLPNPAQRFNEYPHQLSGGMCQRVMIAQALSCNPALLIADEPTTALDVTVQAQILELIRGLQDEIGMSVLYITHDLGRDRRNCGYGGGDVPGAHRRVCRCTYDLSETLCTPIPSGCSKRFRPSGAMHRAIWKISRAMCLYP